MEQRTADRQSAEFATRCTSVGRSASARLLDISPHGCRLQPAEPILFAGNRVRIRISGLSSLDGQVVWQDAGEAGVEFAATLHPAVVAYIAARLSAECDETRQASAALAG